MVDKTIDVQKQDMDLQKQEAELSGVERTRSRRVFVPKADIYETESDFTLLVDMPGVDESSVDITLEKNELTINGDVEPERPEGYSLAYAEYGIGDFQRSFVLSNEIDREKIEASVKNGVLRLVLPKSPAAKSRKISVKAG